MLHGMVLGNVRNAGGWLEIHGTVLGELWQVSGETAIASGARIGRAA